MAMEGLLNESGLHIAGNTTNPAGCKVSPVFATQLPGLNTLGVSMARNKSRLNTLGVIHYQRNVEYGNVVAITVLSSQNPGAITIGNVVFGSTPEIASDILVKAFHLEKTTINYLQSKF
ncbi:RmlC-like cupin domain superfamily [Sesbania bispinosa]|nr:RmlC-like cupin domain superfamily [Sesbania bispinosa]